MSVKKTGEDAYFVASNSANGFFSYYEKCFDDARIDWVYAIKGGPGTGKSRFIRDVATWAETRGYVGEYIYCSSDPTSLDGVILSSPNRTIALIDATAPHTYEPKTPGAREEIVDLGAFWNRQQLKEQEGRIRTLNDKKKKAYRAVYRYLAAYEQMKENRNALVTPYIRTEEMRDYAERLLETVKKGKRFAEQTTLMHAIGMHGEIYLDTFCAQAERIFWVEDCRGAAQYFMHMLYEELIEKRLAIRISFDPILPGCIDGLFLCGERIAFVAFKRGDCAYPHKTISLRRFVNTAAMKEIRPMLNHTEQMCRAMRGGALEAMAGVRSAHYQLEEIYSAAMDFSAKERFTNAFCQGLFS